MNKLRIKLKQEQVDSVLTWNDLNGKYKKEDSVSKGQRTHFGKRRNSWTLPVRIEGNT